MGTTTSTDLTAADRAMPGEDAPPRSPSMRRIFDADWFSGRLGFEEFHGELTDRLCPACATFDGRLRGRSSWANMRRHEAVRVDALPKCDLCIVHFAERGVGLGLGVGQELIVG
jgi:hypothetical protein